MTTPERPHVTPRAAGGALVLAYPFRGRWRAENSPARRVPSHGTARFGLSYAIDFTPVGEDGRSAPLTWRSWVSPEPPERFAGFGRAVLSPAAGTVVEAVDGEPDTPARRTALVQLPWALTQPQRAARGVTALTGNRVTIALSPCGPYVLLAHLQRGSVAVDVGETVAVGDRLGRCGSSGNSTEPHVHVQAVDSLEFPDVGAVPVVFRRPDGSLGLPAEREVVHG